MTIKVWMICYIIYQCFIEENFSTENNGDNWPHKNNLQALTRESEAGLHDLQRKIEIIENNLRNKIYQNKKSLAKDPENENIQYTNKIFNNSTFKTKQGYKKKDEFINHLDPNNRTNNNNEESDKKLKYLYYVNDLLKSKNSLNPKTFNKNIIIENKLDLNKRVPLFESFSQDHINNYGNIPKWIADKDFLRHKPIKNKNEKNQFNANNNASHHENRTSGKMVRRIKFMKKPITEVVNTTPFLEYNNNDKNHSFKFEDLMNNNKTATTTKKFHMFPIYIEKIQVKTTSADQDLLQKFSKFPLKYKLPASDGNLTVTDKAMLVINFCNCSFGNLNISFDGIQKSNDDTNRHKNICQKFNSLPCPDRSNSDTQKIDKASTSRDATNKCSILPDLKLSAKNYLILNNSGKVILNFLNCQEKNKSYGNKETDGGCKLATTKLCLTEKYKKNLSNQNLHLFSQEYNLFYLITTEKDTINVKNVCQENKTHNDTLNHFQDPQKYRSNNKINKIGFECKVGNLRQQKINKNDYAVQNETTKLEKVPDMKTSYIETKTIDLVRIPGIHNSRFNTLKLGKNSFNVNCPDDHASSISITFPSLLQTNIEPPYFNTSAPSALTFLRDESTVKYEFVSTASKNTSILPMNKCGTLFTKNKKVTTLPIHHSFKHKPYKAKKFWNILGKFNSNGNDKTTVIGYDLWDNSSKPNIIKYDPLIRNSSIIINHNKSENSMKKSHRNINKKYLHDNKLNFLKRLHPMTRYMSKKIETKGNYAKNVPRNSSFTMESPLQVINVLKEHNDTGGGDPDDEDDDDNDENAHTMKNMESFQLYKYLIDKSLTNRKEIPRASYDDTFPLVNNINIPYKKENLSFHDRTKFENINQTPKIRIYKEPLYFKMPLDDLNTKTEKYDTLIGYKNLNKMLSNKNKKQKMKSNDTQYLKVWPYQKVRLKKVLMYDPRVYLRDMSAHVQERSQLVRDVGEYVKQDEGFLFRGKELTNTPFINKETSLSDDYSY